ncbi:MAG: hypothetical protein V1720_07470 [bacterium]
MKGISIQKIIYTTLVLIAVFSTTLLYPAGKIALVYSSQTEKNLKGGEWVGKEFTDTELLLLNNRYNYSVIDDTSVDDKLDNSFDLVIVLNAKYLSDEALDSIEKHLNRGGSLLFNWAFAYFDEDGDEREDTVLSKKFDLKIESEISKDSYSYFHTIRGDTPLSFNVPGGFRLKIRTGRNPLSVRANSNRVQSLGYWRSEYELTTGYTPFNKFTGFVYGQEDKSKFVWFGFDTNSVIKTNPYKKIFETLMLNSIDWLLGKTKSEVTAWPSNKKAAVVFSCDVDNADANLNSIIGIFDSKKIKCQFFLSHAPAKKEVVDKLSLHDIGIFTNLNKGFKGQSYDLLYSKFQDIKQNIETVFNKKVFTLKSVRWDYDDNTIKVMRKLGLTTLIGDENKDRSVPEFIFEKILGIPKTGLSFDEILSAQKNTDAGTIAEAMLMDFERVYEENGLYVFNFDSDSFNNPNSLKVMESVIDKLSDKDIWITTFDEVYDWWSKKENIAVNLYKSKENSFEIQIENKNKIGVNNVSVMLSNIVNAQSTIDNKNVFTFFRGATNDLFLNIIKLEPGETAYLKLK